MGEWLLWDSGRELRPTTKQDYRRDKTPHRSNERKNRSQKGWVTSHGHGLCGNSFSRGIIFLLCLSPTSPRGTNCCLLPETGHRAWWVLELASLPALVFSGWSASLSSVSMGWQQKFCPAANGVFQKASFCFFPGQVGEVQQHGCFTRGQFPWLTAGSLFQELVIFQFWQVALHAEIVLKINWNDSAELLKAEAWSWLGLRKKQPPEIRIVCRVP